MPPATVTSPSGAESEVALVEIAPGRWEGRLAATEDGVWRLANGDLAAVAVVGPAAPKEFENPVSSGEALAPRHRGHRRRGAAPGGRHPGPAHGARGARGGRAAAGSVSPTARRSSCATSGRWRLPPAWLMLILAATLAVAAWRIEGR